MKASSEPDPRDISTRVTARPTAGGEGERGRLLAGAIGRAGALCEIASFLAHASWRGELVVHEAEIARSIFFDEGQVVGAQSNAEAERLGAVLARRGDLASEQVAACVERAARDGLRFGEAAVALGYVTREQLFGLMGRQIEEIVCAALRVEDGAFEFYEGFEEACLSFRQQRAVTDLVTIGIKRMEEIRWFRSLIPADDHVPRRGRRGEPADDPLGVWGFVDGARDVAAIRAAVGRDELEVTRALFQLAQSGHVTIDPPTLDVPRIVEVYNGAIRVLLRELDAMDRGDAVRDELATFARNQHDDALLGGAQPADDGTFHAEALATHVTRATDPARAREKLAKWLYDYASYALFLARPHLGRREAARDGFAIASRIGELLEPLAPPGEMTMIPPAEEIVRTTAALPPDERPERASGAAQERLEHEARKQPGAGRSPPSVPANEAAPPSRQATTRMLRVIPGVNPSRTLRLPRVDAPPTGRRERIAEQAAPERARAPRAWPRVVVPKPEAATKRQPAARLVTTPETGPPRTSSDPRFITIGILLFVVGLVAGAAAGWLAHARGGRAVRAGSRAAATDVARSPERTTQARRTSTLSTPSSAAPVAST